MLKKIRRLIVLLLMLMIGWRGYQIYGHVKTVLTYRDMVREVLAENDTIANEDLILAMIYTETKGQQQDVMQSSESWSGQMNVITDSRESVRQGVSVLSENLLLAESYQVDEWTAVQAYNFGAPYIRYVAEHGGQNSVALAKNYSREVLAPSLGNTSAETYTYNNLIALLNGERKLYKNGGNYYYSRQVHFNLFLIKVFSLMA
ncbi:MULTISPECIES: lysozyme family protein [Streptococcus]|uniref:Lysozyme family protein n=1 Tax=Streptococcus caledonicus TaxID=2614158 RepID=A0ABW0UF02_9STRE|nr:lysozyme family protein [Streptococcus sp. S784/96/1]